MKITRSNLKLAIGRVFVAFGVLIVMATFVGVLASSKPPQWESTLRIAGLGIAYLALGIVCLCEKNVAQKRISGSPPHEPVLERSGES
jgi:hypothetical protein